MFCQIKFKACRKCRGDLSLEYDGYGRYYQCIQCGSVYHESHYENHTTNLLSQETSRLPVITVR